MSFIDDISSSKVYVIIDVNRTFNSSNLTHSRNINKIDARTQTSEYYKTNADNNNASIRKVNYIKKLVSNSSFTILTLVS